METDLNNLMYQFREHLKVLNRSPLTVKSYSMHVKHFWYGAVERTGDIKKITRGDIEKYISSLYEYRNKANKLYTTSTISLKVRSIKRFFEYLEDANIIFINPAENIKEPRLQHNLPKLVLTPEEVEKILNQPNLGTRTGIRDRAMLETLYSTGIRNNELTKLTIFDADLQGGLLRVNKGKGFKDRVVPLGKHAVKFIKEYIHNIRPYFTRTRKPRPGAIRPLKREQTRILFLSKNGEPITRGAIREFIRSYTNKSKIRKHVTTHTFRHTFASLLVKNGADIRAVQKMLGHSDIRTTTIYIKLAGANIKKTHKKHHPGERKKTVLEEIKPRINRIRQGYDRD